MGHLTDLSGIVTFIVCQILRGFSFFYEEILYFGLGCCRVTGKDRAALDIFPKVKVGHEKVPVCFQPKPGRALRTGCLRLSAAWREAFPYNIKQHFISGNPVVANPSQPAAPVILPHEIKHGIGGRKLVFEGFQRTGELSAVVVDLHHVLHFL